MKLQWAFLVDSVPFTKAVRDGLTSLGGSESACLGLARALAGRGHEVHIFATRLAEDARGTDAWGVKWHAAEDLPAMNQFVEFDVVVALRMYAWFGAGLKARFRILWNQDLLVPGAGAAVMSVAWALDKVAYVSEYHRRQWEDLQPELQPLGWVTKNGFDPAHVPADATKDPNRIIYITRPERGIAPLLKLWPLLKQRVPEATLHICRYASMYDGEGSNVRAMCLSYDEQVQAVNAEVGGITYLGELNKAQLYKAIAESAVMWYPGVADFAETNCIAATEAQANGTPFVGSLRGALAETAKPSFDAGLLFPGDALRDDLYAQQSVEAVVRLLEGCRRQSFEYRRLQLAGRKHVEGCTYGAIAAEWEAQVEAWFRERYEGNKLAVLRQLLLEDDHVAAKVVASEIVDPVIRDNVWVFPPSGSPEWKLGVRPAYAVEAFEAGQLCDRVIAGKEQGPEDYAAHAIQDPLAELEHSGRFHAVFPKFDGCRRVLDAACGNGAFAIGLALTYPDIRVVGIDYAQANIEHARAAAEKVGVADRVTFLSGVVYDFDRQAVCDLWNILPPEVDETAATDDRFDGLFVGEFVEHVADCSALVDDLEAYLAVGARVVYTCPSGPFAELLSRSTPRQRGHVHNFRQDDVKAVWGHKLQAGADFFAIGVTPRGNPIGHWIIHYRTAPNRPAGERDLVGRAIRTRPLGRLTVGLITRDEENDLTRCLDAIWPIADEIVIGDTGSTDDTKAIAAKFGARILDLPRIGDVAEGFAGARNAVLDAASGEWFAWVDADEKLVDGHLLRKYLDGAVYNGFILHQHHLQLDAASGQYDIPIRVFRRSAPIRFYGCVHEQPQMGDCNGEILPALEVFDVKLAHTGYLTESVRRDKMLNRNLPLLRRDQQVFPERELGKVLVLRDCVNLADYEAEAHQAITAKARKGYAQAVSLFLEYFDDPSHRYHGIARPWYEMALKRLGVGYEIELALAGREGGLDRSRAKPERLWVRDAGEFERLLTHRVRDAAKKMTAVPFKTDPFELLPRETARQDAVHENPAPVA
jgi:glycosyltransferase involved in cell wall biosynthesis/SAM-dependent methyltransferase